MCELLANYSKELSEAETYREKGDVQLKHAKLILDKVKNCSIPDIDKPTIASELIIEATEMKGKRPTQLNFEELIDVVESVAKKLTIHAVVGRNEQLVCDCGDSNMTWYGNDDDKKWFCFNCKKEAN